MENKLERGHCLHIVPLWDGLLLPSLEVASLCYSNPPVFNPASSSGTGWFDDVLIKRLSAFRGTMVEGIDLHEEVIGLVER